MTCRRGFERFSEFWSHLNPAKPVPVDINPWPGWSREDAKVQLAGYVGSPHLGRLAKLAEDRFNQHTVELKASSERLDLSKRRVAALELLRQLPQIYIA